jgi:uncharacterized protein with HEPN domain
VTRHGRRDPERTGDILEAIAKVERWRTLHDKDDDMFRSAVMRELGVIGEAAKALSDEFKTERPDIPWRSIVELRNVLTHHYWDTAWALIEQILDEDLGLLRRSITGSKEPTASVPLLELATVFTSGPSGTCGRWMPRARLHCVLPADHAGGCRSK